MRLSARGPDVKTTPEFKNLSSALQSTQGELQVTQGDLSDAQSDLVDTTSELDTIEGGLPARETALKRANTKLATRETRLTKAKEAVAKREGGVANGEDALAEREKAVGLVETEIAKNTISGDGVYEVGVDMKAGTYKSVDNADCYYAVLGDANGNNILSNNIVSGPAVVSVSAGTFFETTRCGDWTLQV